MEHRRWTAWRCGIAGCTVPAAVQHALSPSVLHVDAAAYAAMLAIDRGEPGTFNIADPNDEVSTDKATAALGWRADFRMDLA